MAFLLVTFSWLVRGFFVALFCLEKQCLGLFRGFFVAPVLGKMYAYSPWNSLDLGAVKETHKQVPKQTGTKMPTLKNSRTCHFDTIRFNTPPSRAIKNSPPNYANDLAKLEIWDLF